MEYGERPARSTGRLGVGSEGDSMFFPLAGTGQTWMGPIAGSDVAKYTRIRSRTFGFAGIGDSASAGILRQYRCGCRYLRSLFRWSSVIKDLSVWRNCGFVCVVSRVWFLFCGLVLTDAVPRFEHQGSLLFPTLSEIRLPQHPARG